MTPSSTLAGFVEDHSDIFEENGGTSLLPAWVLYKKHCEQSGIRQVLPMIRFRDELMIYFEEFHPRTTVNNVPTRNVYKTLKN